MRVRQPTRARFPVAVNHRGKEVGVWLGLAVAGVVAVLTLAVVLARWVAAGELSPRWRDVLWMLGGCAVVCLAGLYDDLRPQRTRGVARQLLELRRGRVAPGVVKLAAIVAAAAVVAWMLGGRGSALAVGVPLVAGTANAWNLLDVAPGRALKFFLPAVAALALVAGSPAFGVLAGASAVAALGALGPDLRERAMLGDAGSNLLGFVVGIGLFVGTPRSVQVVALVAVVVVHVVSETVTLTRVIRATPPLRWFDDLGRIGPS